MDAGSVDARSSVSVVYPLQVHELDFEVELAIIIGKAGRRIKPEDAFAHVAGALPRYVPALLRVSSGASSNESVRMQALLWRTMCRPVTGS
jgi:hypothetical protein